MKVTLHRAGRVAESVKTAIAQTHVPTFVVVSIYSKEPDADIDRARRDFEAGMERKRKLADILADIRKAIGAENARSGVDDALARKHAIDLRLGQIKQIVGDGGKRVTPGPSVSPDEVHERIRAYRSRADSGEGFHHMDEELRVSLVGDAEREALESERIELRRELEKISDKLRELNGTCHIEIADDVWSYLEDQRVI